MYTASNFWLGTAHAHTVLEAAMAQAGQLRSNGNFRPELTSREQLGLAPLYNLQNEVGVVSIPGTLVEGSAGINAYFGVTGYDDIRSAMLAAIMDPEAKTIMLHVNSPGGSVNGLEDLGAFMQMAAAIKPMITYVDGKMASAAYWLGSFSQTIFTGETSMLGSLGVLFVHVEVTQALAAEGRKVTVIRSGEFKALGGSFEVLSAPALQQFQSQGDTLYGLFMGVVSRNRKVSLETADQVMGQGKEFLGAEAVKRKLADKIGTYEQALTYAKSLDTGRTRGNNSQKSTGARVMKVTLNPAQLAAYAAGASMDAMGLSATAEIENIPAEAAAARAAAEAAAANVVDKTAFASLQTANASLTTNLAAVQGQLVAAQAAAVKAGEDLLLAQGAALTARNELTAAKASTEALVAIARSATGKMQIALGTADTTAAMTATEVLAENTRVSALYTAKFVPGGVAAGATGTGTEATASAAAAHENALFLKMMQSGPDALRAAKAGK